MFRKKKDGSQSPRKDNESPTKSPGKSGSPPKGGGGLLTTKMRGMVSMNKVRFQEDGFDLDLTYITKRIIAMGFPSHGTEALYRNPVEKVEQFFNTKYKDHFRVYNLCIERQYDKETRFQGSFKVLPFEDHNAPAPIRIIPDFVDDVKAYLAEDDRNVVAVHCKAGKSRTGVLISSFMMATDPEYRDPKKALERFNTLRTNDGLGVNIPSQIRYVGYYGKILEQYGGKPPPSPPIKISGITLKGGAKWDLYVEIREGPMRMGKEAVTRFDSRKMFGFKSAVSGPGSYSFDLSPFEIIARGDLKIIFKSSKRVGSDDHLFHFWVNTAFVEDGVHTFTKSMLDKAAKDPKNEKFKENLTVTLTTDAAPADARQRGDSEFFAKKQGGGADLPCSPNSVHTPGAASPTSDLPTSPPVDAPPTPPVVPCPFPGVEPAAVVEEEPVEVLGEEEEKGEIVQEEEEVVGVVSAEVVEEVEETAAECRLRELKEQREKRQREREEEKARREKERKEAEQKRKDDAAARDARQREEAETRRREREEKRRAREEARSGRTTTTTSSLSPTSTSPPASPSYDTPTPVFSTPFLEEANADTADPLAALYPESSHSPDPPRTDPVYTPASPTHTPPGVVELALAEVLDPVPASVPIVEDTADVVPSLDIMDAEAELEVQQRATLRAHRKQLFNVEEYHERLAAEQREERTGGDLYVHGVHTEVVSLAMGIIKRVEAIEAACSTTLNGENSVIRKGERGGAREPLSLVALSVLQRSARLEIMVRQEADHRNLRISHRQSFAERS